MPVWINNTVQAISTESPVYSLHSWQANSIVFATAGGANALTLVKA